MRKPARKLAEPKPDTRVHWALADHLCRSCGGRILVSVKNAGMTPGGNPIWKCADCGKAGADMSPEGLCWCGLEMKGNRTTAYICLPFSILDERPWLKQGFAACGCDPERGEVGIMLESSFRSLNETAATMKSGRKVTFEFRDDAAAKRFLDWWSSGFGQSGESSYLKRERERTTPPAPGPRLDYSRAFSAWGYKPDVHGPDYTIQVQSPAADKAAAP